VIRELAVPEGLAGQRLDAALARLLGLSRTKVAELANQGGVQVNGQVASKAAQLKTGDWLRIELDDPPAEPEPVVQLAVVYEDEHLVVVDKPVGVAAHSGPGWDGPTVVGSLLASGHRVAMSGPPERRGVVQRLDVGTSGLMMVAKSEQAYSVLKQMFRDRAVSKVYHGLVQGLPHDLTGTVDAPIGRLPGAYKFAVVHGGKPSVTHFQLLEALPGAALLRLDLETGRTHQIRVHLAAIGHPLVGDPFYGGDPDLAERLGVDRQWLHAVELGFDHPISDLPIRLTTDYPADLTAALDALRSG